MADNVVKSIARNITTDYPGIFFLKNDIIYKNISIGFF